MAKFQDVLKQGILLADGAMGTMLHSRGVGFDQCFDELNLTNPAIVAEVHREYIEAGAGLILTNTFGANRYNWPSTASTSRWPRSIAPAWSWHDGSYLLLSRMC